MKILKYSLIALTLIFSFFSWFSVDRAINLPDSSVWLVPMIWFSLYFLSLGLSFVIIKEKYVLFLLSLFSLSGSFLFVFSFSRIIILVFSWLLLAGAVLKIKQEETLLVKINLGKILQTGKTLIIVSFSLMIASQYYGEARKMESELLIPKFNLGDESGKLTSKIMSAINPQFQNIQNENMTVDEFILLQTQNNQALSNEPVFFGNEEIEKIARENGGKLLAPEQKEVLSAQTLILEEGRKKFSEFAGKKLTGSEKISEILTEAVNNKIGSYFRPAIAEKDGLPALPLIFALVLFLSIVPLGNILMWILLPISRLIFMILANVQVVKVVKIPGEIERIE